MTEKFFKFASGQDFAEKAQDAKKSEDKEFDKQKLLDFFKLQNFGSVIIPIAGEDVAENKTEDAVEKKAEELANQAAINKAIEAAGKARCAWLKAKAAADKAQKDLVPALKRQEEAKEVLSLIDQWRSADGKAVSGLYELYDFLKESLPSSSKVTKDNMDHTSWQLFEAPDPKDTKNKKINFWVLRGFDLTPFQDKKYAKKLPLGPQVNALTIALKFSNIKKKLSLQDPTKAFVWVLQRHQQNLFLAGKINLINPSSTALEKMPVWATDKYDELSLEGGLPVIPRWSAVYDFAKLSTKEDSFSELKKKAGDASVFRDQKFEEMVEKFEGLGESLTKRAILWGDACFSGKPITPTDIEDTEEKISELKFINDISFPMITPVIRNGKEEFRINYKLFAKNTGLTTINPGFAYVQVDQKQLSLKDTFFKDIAVLLMSPSTKPWLPNSIEVFNLEFHMPRNEKIDVTFTADLIELVKGGLKELPHDTINLQLQSPLPPLPPDVVFHSYKGKQDRVLIILNDQVDDDGFSLVKSAVDSLVNPTQKEIDEVYFTFKRVIQHEIQTSENGEKWDDLATLKGGSSAYLDKSIVLNQKKYYKFRSKNNFNQYSEYTPPYIFEIIENSGLFFSNVKIVKVEEPKKATKKLFNKHMKIKPALLQTLLNKEITTKGLVAIKSDLGIGDVKQVWTNKPNLKIRVTSKRTKRKIDLNVNFRLVYKGSFPPAGNKPKQILGEFKID